ncbi:MAG: ACP S-malonyltransferase [Deltaproteobacteria bacterium]|jgi:[acyl-carrier-protein] S-malonyltransferase|nr:ACP S-malonyltransferase [Deltaproteobacteria bacterium]
MNTLALLFPGQGVQEPGMGRKLADASSEAMYIWKQAEQASGLPLRGIYWEGDEAAMADTRALQPALTAANLALWQSVAPGLRVAGAAGHSLGEYAALAAAGVLSVNKVLELVTLRGRLMAEADPDGRGTMCAIVKMDQTAVEGLVRDVLAQSADMLRIANYNTPAQFVLSGSRAAIERASALAGERKGRSLPLKVSGAFHSPYMEPAAKELAKALRKASWSKPRFPVYCNAIGRAVDSGEGIREAMLIQMTSPVRWIEIIGTQWHDGVRHWMELGPKALLAKMVVPILAALPVPEGSAYIAECVNSPEQARHDGQ